jgi:hypothetical protein
VLFKKREGEGEMLLHEGGGGRKKTCERNGRGKGGRGVGRREQQRGSQREWGKARNERGEKNKDKERTERNTQNREKPRDISTLDGV